MSLIPSIPFTRACTTEFGRFKVKIEPTNIYVGGSNYCVNMALDSDVTWLNWLSTDQGGCELDAKVIRKEATVQMVDLAFSLLRTYFPERTEVTLLDASGYSWEGPRRTKYKVNFLNGYVLLHRKTWYEEKFKATMHDDARHIAYRAEVDKGFDDPARKPAVFSFGRAQEYLQPLYQSTHTWGEFMVEFEKKFPDKKYEYMLDWYRQAIYHILNQREIDQTWKIDLTKRPMYTCQWKNNTAGGARKTLRNRKSKRFTFSNYLPMQPFHEDRSHFLSK